MNAHFTTRTKIAVLAAFAGASAAVAIPLGVSASASTPAQHVMTPNQCVQLNGGDYVACNVGNSGRGDLPYRNVAG